MRLKEYIDRISKERDRTPFTICKDLASKCDVGYVTIRNAYHGMLVGKYTTAKAISAATGGEVSVKELCE